MVLTLRAQSGHVCGDSMDLIDGQPTGSVRISFGYSSTLEDARQFLRFVYECFLTNADITASSITDGITASMSGSVSNSVYISVSHSVASSVSVNVSGSVSASISSSVSPAVCDHLTAGVSDGDYQVTSVAADDNGDEVCKDTAAGSSIRVVVADALQLMRIFIYPVKSCAAVEVN